MFDVLREGFEIYKSKWASWLVTLLVTAGIGIVLSAIILAIVGVPIVTSILSISLGKTATAEKMVWTLIGKGLISAVIIAAILALIFGSLISAFWLECYRQIVFEELSIGIALRKAVKFTLKFLVLSIIVTLIIAIVSSVLSTINPILEAIATIIIGILFAYTSGILISTGSLTEAFKRTFTEKAFIAGLKYFIIVIILNIPTAILAYITSILAVLYIVFFASPMASICYWLLGKKDEVI